MVTLTPRSAETDRLWTPRTTYGATEGEHVQDSATVPGIPHRELIKHSQQLLVPPSDPVDSEDWNRYHWMRKGLTRVADCPKLGVYLSHAWRGGGALPAAVQKQLALCWYFNRHAAAVVSSITAVVCALLCILHYQTSTAVILTLCIAVPATVFGLMLLLGNPFREDSSVFLDVACAEQPSWDCPSSGNDKICRARIFSMCLAMARAQRLLVLLNDEYFTRLWCVVETALLLSQKNSKKLTMLPLQLPLVALCTVASGVLAVIAPFCFPEKCIFLTSGVYSAVVYALCLIPFNYGLFKLVRLKQHAPENMRAQLSQFRSDSAKVSIEVDRELLLGLCESLWGGEVCYDGVASDDSHFEYFVKQKLGKMINARAGPGFAPHRLGYFTCLVLSLPVLWNGLTQVVSCGTQNGWWANLLTWLFAFFLASPVVLVLMAQYIRREENMLVCLLLQTATMFGCVLSGRVVVFAIFEKFQLYC